MRRDRRIALRPGDMRGRQPVRKLTAQFQFTPRFDRLLVVVLL